jgi:hypothetical protein
MHFAAQGGSTDLHYAISDGCLELTGVVVLWREVGMLNMRLSAWSK